MGKIFNAIMVGAGAIICLSLWEQSCGERGYIGLGGLLRFFGGHSGPITVEAWVGMGVLYYGRSSGIHIRDVWFGRG